MILIKHAVFGMVFLALFLSGCQNHVTPSEVPRSELQQDILTYWPELAEDSSSEIQVAKLSNRSGGSIGVRIQNTSAPFGVKANLPGSAAKVFSDIVKLRVFLIDASLGIPLGLVTPYPIPTDVFTVDPTGPSQNILFRNVPQGDYQVCVSAFDSSVNFDAGSNLLKVESLATRIFYVEGVSTCSTTGGNANNGVINVGASPNFIVNPNALNVQIDLKPALGATLEVNATINDGV